MSRPEQGSSCPSAQPDMRDARIFGVRSGTEDAPRTAYLERDVEVADALVDGLEGVEPTEVFRYAARCEESRCSHFDGERCTLARRLRDFLQPVARTLPPCTVRATCRWYAEEGEEICFRCPQVVTLSIGSDDLALRDAAAPPAGTGSPAGE